MHKNVNQLKMGTLLSYLTIAIQNISAIIYTPLMLRFLGQNEYGLYQNLPLDKEHLTFNWPEFKQKRDAYVHRLNGIYQKNLEKEKT